MEGGGAVLIDSGRSVGIDLEDLFGNLTLTLLDRLDELYSRRDERKAWGGGRREVKEGEGDRWREKEKEFYLYILIYIYITFKTSKKRRNRRAVKYSPPRMKLHRRQTRDIAQIQIHKCIYIY